MDLKWETSPREEDIVCSSGKAGGGCLAHRAGLTNSLDRKKGVFGNQLKTIVGRVMSGKNETESGVPIDAQFSYVSIANRIVLSPEIIGTTNTLLKVISKRVAGVYFGREKK